MLIVGVDWPMETFIERLLTGLSRSGLQLTIMSKRPPPNDWRDVHGISWTFGPGLPAVRHVRRQIRRRSPRAAAAVAAAWVRARAGASRANGIDTSGADVVYAPWISVLVQHLGQVPTTIPVVTSCRGALITIAPWDPSRPGYRDDLARVLDEASLVHCVSDQIVQDAVEIGLDTRKARVIRPAVDPAAYTPRNHAVAAPGPVVVVGVGGLTWRKDYEHALVGVRKAIDLGADLRFDLIGGGVDHQHLVFTIHDLGLTNHVHLLGHRSPEEVAAALAGADVFLHTSSSEGISNAVLEAMATGLPVVTTEAGGMREAVRNHVDGIVVGVRDSNATAAALVSLAADRDLRTRLGTSARQRVIDDFNLRDQVAGFRSLLDEAVGR